MPTPLRMHPSAACLLPLSTPGIFLLGLRVRSNGHTSETRDPPELDCGVIFCDAGAVAVSGYRECLRVAQGTDSVYKGSGFAEEAAAVGGDRDCPGGAEGLACQHTCRAPPL